LLLFDVELVTDVDIPDELEDTIKDTVVGDDTHNPAEVRVAETGAAVVDTQMIEKAADDIMELFKDGFQASDIFPALSRLIEMAEVVQGASGEEKKQLVIQGAKRAYQKLDPDISSWIPQWLEHRAVNWALDAVLPYAVDWAIDVSKGKLNVNKEE